MIDRFNDYLRDSLRALRDLKAATTHRDLQGQLSIDAFFRAAVGFEAFQSDWLIAVVQRDPSGFLPPQWWTHVEQSVAPKLGEGEADLEPALVGAYKRIAKRPRSEDVRAVMDPGDRNVTFKDVNDLRRRGVVELAAPYRARVETLLRDQRKLIDAVLAVRNCIAHRSPTSVGRMNEKLRAVGSSPRQSKCQLHEPRLISGRESNTEGSHAVRDIPSAPARGCRNSEGLNLLLESKLVHKSVDWWLGEPLS